ncbi:MAG: dTMP kinase [Candidatus Bathyarchaeota archaeon]|nr:dTMP kinase [Candidatus Bathyarchaeota archaeon]
MTGLSQKGCLIVFEGIEGSGKTTASRNLEKYLSTKGYKILWTREPTISKIGTLIQSILMGSTPVAEEAIPLLFAADRADHTRRRIIPEINKGTVVISDRYVHSSLAYQKSGMSKVFKQEWLESINKFSINPDLVIFLDISPEEGLNRIGKWQRIHDDKFFENIETQKRIRKAYYEILKLNRQQKQTSLFEKPLFSTSLNKAKTTSDTDGMTIVTIDASLKQGEIQNTVNDVVQRFLKTNGIENQLPRRGSALDSTLL